MTSVTLEQNDFAIYYTAARVSLLSPAQLYTSGIWNQIIGLNLSSNSDVPYLYLPTFALILRPLALLPYQTAEQVWFFINIFALLLTVICLYLSGSEKSASFVGSLMWLLAPATFDTLHFGQINALLGLLITASLLGLRSTKPGTQVLAGSLLGLAGGIKFLLLPLIILAPLTRKWMYGWGAILGLAILVAVGLISFPLSTWSDFFRILTATTGGLAPPGLYYESMVQNQSLFAFWHKLTFTGVIPLQFQTQFIGAITVKPVIAPTLASLLSAITAAAMVSFTGLALWRLYRHAKDASVIASGIILLAALMLSPLTWAHYLTMVPPVFLALQRIYRRVSPVSQLLLSTGYLFVVLHRGIVILLHIVPVLILSSLFLAGLCLWWWVLIEYALVGPRE
ncbi:MAG: DUF2029 domain-containing protein [Chloroflexi bacterium]|nr:DUF2029 domain-containing protein [Chloroflexota bacterium]